MKKFVFIFAIASAILAGCSECSIVAPEPGIVPPPEPSRGYSSDRVKAFSVAVSDSTEDSKVSIDSLLKEN